jgi:hypothetical protein
MTVEKLHRKYCVLQGQISELVMKITLLKNKVIEQRKKNEGPSESLLLEYETKMPQFQQDMATYDAEMQKIRRKLKEVNAIN